MTKPTERIRQIEANMRLDGRLHPSVIDACQENAWDMGLSETIDPDAFWLEVLSQLLGELDAEGYNADGTEKDDQS